jgi:hypothetical protein
MGKNYNTLEMFTPSHLNIEVLKTWTLKQPTKRHIPHELFFINSAVHKPNYNLILLMHVKTYRPNKGTFRFCVSAGSNKRTALDNNNTNTVKAALSESIYVHRALKAEWEELNEAGNFWANGRHKTH